MKALKDDSVVPLDPKTARRLAKLARVTGERPALLVAKLLHDILEDDAQAHAPARH